MPRITKKRVIITGAVVLVSIYAVALFIDVNRKPVETTQPPAVSQPVVPVSDITIDNLQHRVNEERVRAGLSPLALSQALNDSAVEKCQDMATSDYWAHDRPDGTSWTSFVRKHVISYRHVGENLASNYATTDGVVTGWMNSPGHKANIVRDGYNYVGYGICTDESRGTIVVQHLVEL